MSTSFYLETTDVPPERSAQEILGFLVRIGARQVSTQYGEGGKLVGMLWILTVRKHEISFAMPARVDGVFTYLKQRQRGTGGDLKKLRIKAERIAWRQLLNWIKIQHALIETGMVAPEEVFMPYACAPGSGQTMFQVWNNQLALPPAEGK